MSKGEDYSSGWEYESRDEEEANYDEVSGVAKEPELINVHMSNAKVAYELNILCLPYALVGSSGPTNSESRRGKRSATIGHGLQEYVKRNGGRKMKIDFSEGRARPADSNQASKLTSECGIHTRNKMHVATHWKDYKEPVLAHIIPNAIKSKKFEMDTKDEVAKDRDCFKGRTVEEALSKRPRHVTQENWEDLVNKWSDERNQEISAKNKQNREAVKHQPKTGSRCYIAHFHQLKKDKYNNEDPSPIDFFKDTHIDKKTGRMSEEAQIAYTAMENKRRQAQSEGGHLVSDAQIVAEVLKEHTASSTFLSSMGLQSRPGSSKPSASALRIQELEERVQQQDMEAREANEMYQQELNKKVEAQEYALQEMQRKQQEDPEAVKKSQQEREEAWAKKQAETDALLSFLLRKHGA
ncbi:hypothetical protein BRADI_1g28901v3 [Brachypodium distachyon]|uniref:Uncharacterized protein n=1 Tax=Brachypodium distachyon TaxID=15368 RepID=A0A0Q3JEP0_BRADI|nr:hypothetical protein BRADI_1g28901v3 [Brachypodium distachyon]